MSQVLYPPARPQSIGEVLDTGFRIFQSSLGRCLVYGALYVIAGQLANIYTLAAGHPLGQVRRDDPLWWAFYAVAVVTTIILWSAIMLRQNAIASGAPISFRAELGHVLVRLFRLIALVIACVIVVIVGLVLFVVPGLYLAVALAFSLPAMVLRDHGVVSAMRHSLSLVRGNWWRTTIIFTVAGTVLFMLYGLALMLSALLLPFAGAEDIAVVTAATAAVAVAMGAIAAPFFCAVLLATFAELRVRREGIDLEQRIAAAAAS